MQANKGKRPKKVFNLGDIFIKENNKKKTVLVIQLNDKDRFFFKYKTVEEKQEWLAAMREGQKLAVREDTVVISREMMKPTLEDALAQSVSPKNLEPLRNTEDNKLDELDDKSNNSDYEVYSSPEMNMERPHSVSPETVDYFGENAVINKNKILEDISKVFYETQMLSNESPMTKELTSIKEATKGMQVKLQHILVESVNKEGGPEAQKSTAEALNELGDILASLERLINISETQREKLFPIGERIALIELEKNPYKLPGDTYKRIRMTHHDNNERLSDNDEEGVESSKNDEEDKEALDDDSDDSNSIDETMFYE